MNDKVKDKARKAHTTGTHVVVTTLAGTNIGALAHNVINDRSTVNMAASAAAAAGSVAVAYKHGRNKTSKKK